MDRGAWQTIVHGITKSWTHILGKILVENTRIYCGSASKESTRNAGDLGSILGLGGSPGGGNGYPLQYSGLKNPHGQWSLVGYSPWGCTGSDTTECLNTHTCEEYV